MVIRIPFLLFFLALVSALIIFLQSGEVNRDGVMYLTQAQFLIDGRWDKAMEVYNWPFFSILIFLIHSITSYSVQYSAHLIDVSCFLIATFFFLKNIEFISRGKVAPVYGLVILLTSIHLVDDYLGMILRDHGQWAGFMMGTYAYLRWVEKENWLWAFIWQFGFLFGALFRPECILFNIFLPFTHQIFLKPEIHIASFFQSISIVLLGIIALSFLWLFSSIDILNLELARLHEIITRPQKFLQNLTTPLPIKSNNFRLQFLLIDFSSSFKYFFLTYVAIYKWITGVGFLHLGLFFLGLRQQLIKQPFFTALFIFFVLSCVITVFILYQTFLIPSRYWMMNWWIVYIFATFGLYYLFGNLKKIKHPQKKLLQYILIIILGIYFLNALIDRPEKHFEQSAGDWIKQQQLDLNNIYFNERRIAFYAGLIAFDPVGFDDAVNTIQYSYIVMRYNKFDEVKPINNYKAIKYFPSIKKPKVIIYQRLNVE